MDELDELDASSAVMCNTIEFGILFGEFNYFCSVFYFLNHVKNERLRVPHGKLLKVALQSKSISFTCNCSHFKMKNRM